MMIGRTANPALKDSTFTAFTRQTENAMTLQGTINKSFILIALLMISAGWTWINTAGETLSLGLPMVGAIGGFIVALITIFKKHLAPITAPIYAILEGLFIGGISAIFEMRYPGIVVQAVTLTIGVFVALLLAYTSRLIKPTENFKLGIIAATGGIAILYLLSFVMSFFGGSISIIHSSSLFGIGFSVVVVIIAALNLVLDFDFIENGARYGAPKFMEWFAAFGLLVTLVWLYIEILRLLAKLRNR